MYGSMLGYGLGAVLLLTATLAQPLAAQEIACEEGAWVAGTLGYAELECNCTIGILEGDPPRRVYNFRSEPKIGGIRRGGPSDGRLKDGDIIVAIDGHLITTREGGRRFGSLMPGAPVRLTVRRDGREVHVQVTPAAECVSIDVAPKPPVAPPKRAVWELTPGETPTPPVAPMPAPAPPLEALAGLPPSDALPRGWLGFSISCSDCSIERIKLGDQALIWTFSSFPVVERVEQEGPAHQARMRPGDVLTHLNGISLTTEAGGRAFGAVEPGDTVHFRYLRDGREAETQMVAGERGWSPRPPKAALEVNRFSAVLGDAFIQVSGGPITVTRTEDEIVIRSQDITVRIKKSGGS